MEVKRIRIWEPPMAEEQEVYAELRYEDVLFEIPYTLMHMIAGWVAIGAHDSVALGGMEKPTVATFNYLERVMGFDSSPLSEEDRQFYKSVPGARIERPQPMEFKEIPDADQ